MTLQKVLTKWIIVHGDGGKIDNIRDILKYHIKQRIVRNLDEVFLIKPGPYDKRTYTIFDAPATTILNISKTLWDHLKRNDIEIQDYYDKFINYDFNDSLNVKSCSEYRKNPIKEFLRLKNTQSGNNVYHDAKENRNDNAFHVIESGQKSLDKSRKDIRKCYNIENTTPLAIQTINKTNLIEIHDDIYEFSIDNTDCMALLLRKDFNRTSYKLVNEILPKIKDMECSKIINAHSGNGLFLMESGFSKLKFIYLFHNERDIPINTDIDGIPDLINDCLTRLSGHQIKRISINGNWGQRDTAVITINTKELISNKIKLSIKKWLIDNQNTDIEDIFIII